MCTGRNKKVIETLKEFLPLEIIMQYLHKDTHKILKVLMIKTIFFLYINRWPFY